MYFYTTVNDQPEGRASAFYRSKASAESRCDEQNAKAETLGLKARYSVQKHDGKGVSKTEIRD